MKHYRSICSLDCFDICSIELAVENNQIKKIGGNPSHPVTKGFLCQKGMAHAQRVTSPQRLTQPMKKVDNAWVPLAWPQAIAEIAGHFTRALAQGGPQSLLYYTDAGHGGLGKNIDVAFMNELGQVHLPIGSLCWGAGIAAQKLDFGRVLGHAPEDHLLAKTILIWGRNPADTNIHLMPYLQEAKKAGIHVVVIDPVRTKTAQAATHYYQLLPESDGALALALAKILIQNQWHDQNFVANHADGYGDYLAALDRLSLEELIQSTGLTPGQVFELAELYGNHKPAAIILGYGLQRYPTGGATIRQIDALAALAGQVGQPGGGVTYANQYVKQWIDWDYAENTPAEEPLTYIRSQFPRQVFEAQTPIQVMLVTKSNPLVQLPDVAQVAKAMAQIPVKIVIDLFMTDTAQQADYVLPCTHIFEEEELIFTSMWHAFYGVTQPALQPPEGVKEEFEIFTLLAQAMGLEGFLNKYPDKPTYLKRAMAPLLEKTGQPYEALVGQIKKLEGNDVPWQNRVFATATGRYQFAVPAFRPVSPDQDYPLRLLSLHPRHSLHSQHFVEMAPGTLPTVYLAPATLAAHGLEAGQPAELISAYGKIKAIAQADATMLPDMMTIYEGWWHKHQCINLLTSPQVSDLGNQAIYNHCFCRIAPLSQADA